jgi:hypothetical protein
MRNESDPYAPPLTRDEPQTTKRLSRNAWVLAYLISVAAPFVCLRIERAISTFQCILGIVAGLLVHVGTIPLLAKTEGKPIQPVLLVLCMTGYYLIVLWQYRAGHAVSLWSEDAERQWRTAGRFFGGFIGIGFAAVLFLFLLRGR